MWVGVIIMCDRCHVRKFDTKKNILPNLHWKFRLYSITFTPN